MFAISALLGDDMLIQCLQLVTLPPCGQKINAHRFLHCKDIPRQYIDARSAERKENELEKEQ